MLDHTGLINSYGSLCLVAQLPDVHTLICSIPRHGRDAPCAHDCGRTPSPVGG
jgi:hypothetical protein